MATGPQHYAEAERLIDEAKQHLTVGRSGRLLAEAQVHATLALAAATALGNPNFNDWKDRSVWDDVASVRGVRNGHLV